LSIQRRNSRTLRMLARNSTSNASAGDRHGADHTLNCDIAEHARRDMPGRPERARLAHQPERQRGCNDVTDHRDQPDDAVEAVADLGARQDEGDVEQFRQRIQPL
jgi:hypothetical protein